MPEMPFSDILEGNLLVDDLRKRVRLQISDKLGELKGSKFSG